MEICPRSRPGRGYDEPSCCERDTKTGPAGLGGFIFPGHAMAYSNAQLSSDTKDLDLVSTLQRQAVTANGSTPGKNGSLQRGGKRKKRPSRFARMGQKRRDANERERVRMRKITNALLVLRKVLWKNQPSSVYSEILTLTTATKYIGLLGQILETGELPEIKQDYPASILFHRYLENGKLGKNSDALALLEKACSAPEASETEREDDGRSEEIAWSVTSTSSLDHSEVPADSQTLSFPVASTPPDQSLSAQRPVNYMEQDEGTVSMKKGGREENMEQLLMAITNLTSCFSDDEIQVLLSNLPGHKLSQLRDALERVSRAIGMTDMYNSIERDLQQQYSGSSRRLSNASSSTSMSLLTSLSTPASIVQEPPLPYSAEDVSGFGLDALDPAAMAKPQSLLSHAPINTTMTSPAVPLEARMSYGFIDSMATAGNHLMLPSFGDIPSLPRDPATGKLMLLPETGTLRWKHSEVGSQTSFQHSPSALFSAAARSLQKLTPESLPSTDSFLPEQMPRDSSAANRFFGPSSSDSQSLHSAAGRPSERLVQGVTQGEKLHQGNSNSEYWYGC